MLGLELTQGVDLSGVTTLVELAGALRAEREAHPGGWLQGWGLNPNAFGTCEMTAAPMVAAVGDIPALIILFDAHSAIATPAALLLAGIAGPRAFDGGAEVVCDESGDADRASGGDPGVRPGPRGDAQADPASEESSCAPCWPAWPPPA